MPILNLSKSFPIANIGIFLEYPIFNNLKVDFLKKEVNQVTVLSRDISEALFLAYSSSQTGRQFRSLADGLFYHFAELCSMGGR